MRIVKAVLVTHEVEGWPDHVISPSVPLGKTYRVDLDTKGKGTLHNLEHPEWGVRELEVIVDIDDGYPLPVCCLRIDAPL